MKRILLTIALLFIADPVFAAGPKGYVQTTEPASCSTGDFWIDTDGAIDNRFYNCTSINTWTLNNTRPRVYQATAPADTTLDWYDTDDEPGVYVQKVYNGGWHRVGSYGVVKQSECSTISDGFCVDTDDGKLYYHNGTSVVELATGTGAVDSVNGQTGTVVLDADDIDDTSTTNKFTSSTEKSTWNSKQDALVSGANIKTINGTSVLGAGDVVITGGSMVYPTAGNIAYTSDGTSWTTLTPGTGIIAALAAGFATDGFQPYDANMITWPVGVTATEIGYLDGLTDTIVNLLAAKANSANIAFIAGALSDMKILDTAQPVDGTQWLLDTVAYGDTDDNLHFWSVEKIGSLLEGKLSTTVLDDTKGNGDTGYIWSADKVYDQLTLKAESNHTHTGVYEPADATILKDADIGYTVQAYDAQLNNDAIEFVIDGGGSAITTGIKGFLEVPYTATINRVTVVCDQSGSIVVDVWKDSYANYPPTDADSITASTVPTVSTATNYQDTTLTGWTTSLTAGDFIGFNVDSASIVTNCTISLKVTK